jgi:hypothetical protein
VPFETGVIPSAEVGTFDLVFTSPPYFDVELYQSERAEDPQSIAAFPRLDDWLRGWLFPAMDRAYAALREGGHFALYINDFPGLDMCHPILEHAATMPDCRWVGILGVEGETGRTRPLWLWRKGRRDPATPLYGLVARAAAAPGP